MAHDLIDFNEPERMQNKGHEIDSISHQRTPPPSKSSLKLDLLVKCLLISWQQRKLTKTYKTSLGEMSTTFIFLNEIINMPSHFRS